MSKYLFRVVESKRKKVLIDTDAYNEADDQFAIVHALLTPMFDVRGIVATHFGHDRIEDSMQASYDEVLRVLEHMGQTGRVPVARGAKSGIAPLDARGGYFNRYRPEDSDGARMIIDEAMALPAGERLYLAVLGPLTNVASALMLEPRIAHRVVVAWNGGGIYPHGEREFNLVNDIAAANLLFASEVELWQIPTEVYAMPRVSLAEMQLKVQPCGAIGDYLFRRVLAFYEEMKDVPGWPLPESLDICDLTVIGVLMEPHKFCYDYKPAPFITGEMCYQPAPHNRPIRVYHGVDARYIVEDLFCKLAINYR